MTEYKVNEKIGDAVLTAAFGEGWVIENTPGDIGEYLEGDQIKWGLPDEDAKKVEVLIDLLEKYINEEYDTNRVLDVACNLKSILMQYYCDPNTGGDLVDAIPQIDQLIVLMSIDLYLKLM